MTDKTWHEVYNLTPNARAVPRHIKEALRARLAQVQASIDTLKSDLVPFQNEERKIRSLLAKPDIIDAGLAYKGGKPTRMSIALDIAKEYPDGLKAMELAKRAGWGYQNAHLVLREAVAKDLLFRGARGLYFPRAAALAQLAQERAEAAARQAEADGRARAPDSPEAALAAATVQRAQASAAEASRAVPPKRRL